MSSTRQKADTMCKLSGSVDKMRTRKHKPHIVLILTLSLVGLILPQAVCLGATTDQISQFGITWTFDKEYEYGQFANGDFWVVGPVTIISVSPAPSSGRNGSMINPITGSLQGYDNRIGEYDPSLSVSFPRILQPGESLVSAESLVGTDPACPDGYTMGLMGKCLRSGHTYLKTAAVLTVLASVPPTDSFRPPMCWLSFHRVGLSPTGQYECAKRSSYCPVGESPTR